MRLLILIFTIFSVNYCFSQKTENYTASYANEKNTFNAFKAGEKLEYRISYGLFNSSYAALSVSNDSIYGKKVLKATSIGRTTGLARLFFKVEDLYETFFPLNYVKPLKSVRDIYEGGYQRKTNTRYNHENNKAIFIDELKNIEREIKIPSNVQDLISTFYYLRKHYDISTLKPKDLIYIDIFFDEEIYPFKMMFLGTEKIKTKFGVIDCLKLKPYMDSGRVFRGNDGIKIWVSNDDNRIPIKVKADLRVGSIIANLTSFRGLANPFKIVINE